MAKKPSVTTVASGYQSTTTINDNTQNLRDAFDNTLSLDGSTPNAMQADLDINSNDILNVNKLYINGLYIDGQPVSAGTLNYNGVIKETQTATSGQTVFNLTTMVYNPGINSLSVYVDGVYQNPSTYTENNSTRITFSAGLHVGAIVDFVALSINEITGGADATTITYTPNAQSLYGSSTTVKSALDQISNQGTGSSKVGFLQVGTSATNRTVQAKLRESVSVKDFGAVGDGVTDDTAAINAALTASAAVYFPAGIYKTSSTIIASYAKKQGPQLYGDGPHATKIQPTSAVSVALQIGESFAFTNDYLVNGIGVDLVNMTDATTSVGLAFDSAYYGAVQNFRTFNDGTNKRCISFTKSSYVTRFSECVGRIFEIKGENSSSRSTTILVQNSEFYQAYIRNAEFINFKDCHIGPSGSLLDKFDCDTVRDLFASGVNIEGSGVAWKLGTNCERFFRIGNFYTGFSGTYQTGSFINTQNSYDLDGWLTSEMHNSQTQSFVAAYQAGRSQIFRTVTGNLSGPSFQHDANETMRIKFGNSASDSHVLWDINNNVDLQSRNGTFTFGNSNGGAQVVCQTDKNFRPSDNGVTNLGTVANKWATVYAATGTINTSDVREKTDVALLTAKERAVATRVKNLLVSYRLKNNADKKRFGVIAQDLIAAFEAEGLNASDYGVIDIPDDPNASMGVNYSELFALVLAAI